MFKKMKKIDKFKVYCSVIGVILVLTCFIRAKITGITYDEAFTYAYYVQKNPIDVFKTMFIKGTLANNHLLNSFFISLFQCIIKNHKYSELLIRLPNLIFYITYITYSYKISKNKKYKYLLFTLLVGNYAHYEFFGMARGYGIASTFIIAAIYYLNKYNELNKYKYLNISYFLSILACFSNTVSLIIFASILVYSYILLLKDKKVFNYIKNNWHYIIGIIILTLLLIKYHFMVSEGTLPTYGSNDNFFESFIISLVSSYGFSKFKVVIGILLSLLMMILIIKKIKNKEQLNISLLTFICIVLLIIMTLFTKQKWITGRSLIPFFPVITITIYYALEELIDIKILINLIIVCLYVNFIINFNLHHTREWIDDYQIKNKCYQAYYLKNKLLIEDIKGHPSTNFYREKIIYLYDYDIYN